MVNKNPKPRRSFQKIVLVKNKTDDTLECRLTNLRENPLTSL